MKISCLVFLGAALAAIPLSAKTVQAPGENITLDIPDAWAVADKPGALLYATDSNNVSAVGIKKFSNDSGHGITPSFIDGLKNGFIGQGPALGGTMTVTAENALTMGGAPAYLVQTVLTQPTKKVQMRSYVVATHDAFYLVSLQTIDPAKEADLLAVASSFHFLTPPTLPDSGLNDFDAEEQVGRYIGYALPLLVLAVLVKIVVRKTRRASS